MSTFLTRDMRNIGERTETYESACVEGWLLSVYNTDKNRVRVLSEIQD